MKLSEIAPPGREKQVKKLKKKFDDPGAPYAIAWAQHNKHGKPKKNEGRMSEIDADIKTLSDQEFQKKYGKSKEQMKKDLNESTEHDTIKSILAKHSVKSTDDIEYGSEVYNELFGYYMNSGEMPYGIMKAREGDPDQWIADRIDDLGLLEQDDPLSTKLNADEIKKKALIYMMRQHKNSYGDSSPQKLKNIESMIAHLKDGAPLNPALQNILNQELHNAKVKDRTGRFAMRKMDVDRFYKDEVRQYKPTQSQKKGMASKQSSAQITKKLGPKAKVKKPAQADVDADGVTSVAQAFKKGYGESTDVDEAPFGAVKKAMNTAKRVAGVVPGLGDVGQQAKGERAMGQVANKIWQSFQQFQASNPNEDQVKGWFQKNYKLDVTNAMVGGKVDQNKILQAVKDQYAKDKSGAAGDAQQNTTPNTQPGSNDQTDAKSNDLKVQMSLLKKIAPEVEPSPALRAIKTMATGKPVNPSLQQVISPIMKKVAKALTQPSKTTMLQRALAESLSQSDLSKLDMLARQGMVPKNKVARFKTAMRTLAKGKDIPISYKDDVIDVVMKLSKIITKPSVMGMIRKGLRENQDPKNTFDKWVKKAKDKHNI